MVIRASPWRKTAEEIFGCSMETLTKRDDDNKLVEAPSYLQTAPYDDKNLEGKSEYTLQPYRVQWKTPAEPEGKPSPNHLSLQTHLVKHAGVNKQLAGSHLPPCPGLCALEHCLLVRPYQASVVRRHIVVSLDLCVRRPRFNALQGCTLSTVRCYC